MKTKTKRFGILLLSAGMILSAAFATGMILNESDGLIANADNSRGMKVLTNAPRNAYWDNTQMSIPLTFNAGQAPQSNSLMSVDSLVKDYVEIDGVKASPNVGWYHMGNSPFNPADRNDFTLTFWTQNSDWLKSIKEVKLLAGFSWVTSDTQAAFPTPGTGYYKLEGTEFAEDVIIWNGGESGWLNRAKSFTASIPENIEVPKGGTFDTSVLTVTATLLDGSTTETVAPAACTVDLDTSEVGEQEITVHYQDLTFKPANKVKIVAAKTLTKIELSEDSITTPQYEVPTLADITVTATYDDNSTDTVPIGDCTIAFQDRNQIWTVGGTTTATVSYTLRGTTVSDTLTVTVGEPDLTTGLVPWTERVDAGTRFTDTMLQFPFKATFDINLDKNIFHTELFTGNHIVDYVELTYNGETKPLAEWIGPMAIDTRVFNSGMFIINSDQHKEFIAGVTKITFKTGFEWITADADNWGVSSEQSYINANYYTVSNLVLKKDYSFYNGGKSGWETIATSIEAEYTGGEIAIGDKINPEDVKVTASFADGSTKNIPVTDAMLQYEPFESAGPKEITVKYQDQTDTIEVVVKDEILTGIEVATNPSKVEYEVGDWTVDLSGIVVNGVYHTGTGDIKRPVDASALTATGIDVYAPTEQYAITVTYLDFTANFNIKIVPSTWGGITVNWQSGGGFQAAKQSPNLTIPVSVLGVSTDDTKAVKLWGDEDHVIDYLEINGKPARSYLNKGLAWVGFFAQELTLTFHGTDLVWSTWADGTSDGSSDAGTYYVEGKSEVVETVKILKGFTWYTSADGKDKWPPAEGEKFVKVPHAILSEDIMLYNDDGYGWMRVLKQDGDKVADDALTIESMPDKTTYQQGEKFDPTGCKIHLKYEDGGEESVTVVGSDIKGFNSSVTGKQSVTIDYLDKKYYQLKIEVTVEASTTPGENPGGETPGENPGGTTPGENPGETPGGTTPGGDEPAEEKGGCGSVISAGAGILAALVVIGAACVVFLKKRKE